MFANKALGIELCSEGARIALVSGKRDAPGLAAFSEVSFPIDTLRFNMREENVLNRSSFVAIMRELHLKLLSNVKKVSLSLPDSTGRVILLDVETRFKSREEGADIIRWKLKKNYPIDINETHLDYQTVQERETGEISILVSLIARPIVLQYEDLLMEAGLEPNKIDFTSFNLYSLFSQRLELSENPLLVTCYGGVVGVMVFNGGKIEFCRAKDVPGGIKEPNRVFREINSSFLVFKEKNPAHLPTEAFCIISEGDAEAFCALVAEATGLDPILLDAERIITHGDCPGADLKTLRRYAASIGAAVRNL
jgi:type IV pilus assembly protein PilM